MRVLILHNEVSADDSASDRDVLVQVDAVAAALASRGHGAEVASCTLDLEAVRRRLTVARPDVVFQLVESLAGFDRMAVAVTSLLDALDVPYTGGCTESLVQTNHKLSAKRCLRAAGLPTPDWIADGDDVPVAVFPQPQRFLVKTISEHASLGLDDDSVVTASDAATVRDFVRAKTEQLGRPCFAEAFVDGREFNLSVVAGPDGPAVLPPAEIDFSAFPKDKLRIVGYRAKWDDDSFESIHSPRRFDFPAGDAPLLGRLAETAAACWRVFRLGGYARVDFRVDAAGRPWILEVNVNPCLSPDAGFAAALERASIPYATAVEWMLDDALRGRGRPANSADRGVA